jgi:hypothetical protein
MEDGAYLQDGNKQKIPGSPVIGEQRQSVELALRTILTHVHKNNVKRDDIIFEDLDIRWFNLSNIKCQLTGIIFHEVLAHKVDFRETTLENAHFIGGNFYEAKFHKAILNGTQFYETTNLHEAKFTKAELNRAIFYSCELYMAFFNGVELECADFTSVDLNSNIVTSYTGNREEKKDIRGAKNITQKQLVLIIYKEGKPPINRPDDLKYPENRAYIEKDDKRFFVESTAPWLGKLVDDVIAEIIEADKT